MYIKYYKDISNNQEINNIYKNPEEGESYILMKVPFVKNIKSYIYKIHSNNSHRGIDAIRNIFIKNKIYYKGITNDIKDVIKNCAICKIKNSKLDLKKRKNLN